MGDDITTTPNPAAQFGDDRPTVSSLVLVGFFLVFAALVVGGIMGQVEATVVDGGAYRYDEEKYNWLAAIVAGGPFLIAGIVAIGLGVVVDELRASREGRE